MRPRWARLHCTSPASPGASRGSARPFHHRTVLPGAARNADDDIITKGRPESHPVGAFTPGVRRRPTCGRAHGALRDPPSMAVHQHDQLNPGPMDPQSALDGAPTGTCRAVFGPMPSWVPRSGDVAVRLRCHRRALAVSPGRTVCRSVHVVSDLEGSSDAIWDRLPSCWGRCYTAATWDTSPSDRPSSHSRRIPSVSRRQTPPGRPCGDHNGRTTGRRCQGTPRRVVPSWQTLVPCSWQTESQLVA